METISVYVSAKMKAWLKLESSEAGETLAAFAGAIISGASPIEDESIAKLERRGSGARLYIPGDIMADLKWEGVRAVSLRRTSDIVTLKPLR